ncbi:MAG: hypothetical protein JWP49_1046 [Phenylobacterium sp.]|jgi:hypothetical protein|nr:hypothetical protein [Phenylobacterium sp.]
MRALFLALAFVLAAAAAPAFAQAPPAGWKPFYYPDLHVAFMGPPQAQPTIQKGMIDVAGAPGMKATDDHITVFDAGHSAYMIGISDWTGNSHPMSVDGVPAGAVKGMDMTFVGPVRTIAWPGGDAREYDASKGAMVVRSRAIVVGRRLFQAMVLSNTGALPADADAFLAAVKPLP